MQYYEHLSPLNYLISERLSNPPFTVKSYNLIKKIKLFRLSPPMLKNRVILSILFAAVQSTTLYNDTYLNITLNASRGFVVQTNNDTAGHFGTHTCGIGDFNADGIEDVAISAYSASPLGRTSAGVVYIIYGRRGNTVTTFDPNVSLSISQGLQIYGSMASDLLGVTLNSAGDVNSGGIPDIITGASTASPLGRSQAGIAYVCYGKKGGYSANIDLNNTLPISQGFRILGGLSGDLLRKSVNSAGDFNDDGVTDIIVGSALSSSAPGKAYLIYGQAGGMSSDIDVNLTLSASQGFRILVEYTTSISVAPGGDFNGDGIADVIIGVPTAATRGNSNGGSTYVVYGTKAGYFGDFDLTATTNTSQRFKIVGCTSPPRGMITITYLGYDVSSAGDFNGDNITDNIIGAAAGGRGYYGTGVAVIIYGVQGGITADINMNNGLSTSSGFYIKNTNSGYFGCAVKNLGDINNDGIADVLIGAFATAVNGNSNVGYAVALYGQSGNSTTSFDINAGFSNTQGFQMFGAGPSFSLGRSVGVVDFNGDGINDILVGSPGASYDTDGTDGAFYLLYSSKIAFREI